MSDAAAQVAGALLGARNAAGHWEGELSNSALSTATALFALSLFDRAGGESSGAFDHDHVRRLVRGGIDWLLQHQNADGGWGDTVLSLSNISTTALCWAALSLAGPDAAEAIRRCEAWLIREAGSLEPGRLAVAITARYGKDRTFSVPILTTCALAGRLGAGRAAWRLVPQLPFELAACPYQWFQWIKLPVVSYALPALIAMGLVRHRSRPTLNPAARTLRQLTCARALRLLREIQPASGGFLEATPLTSFVVMSLVGAGEASHPVVRHGVEFLVRSARPDGSWPIDTNLATWLTTLSVNALAQRVDFAEILPEADRRRILDWLLAQQYRVEHPYTHAAPGGWAWTDLPGGVPDADDTAGALLALHHLGNCGEPRVVEAAAAGVRWLLDLQNRDGGVPTFCRGWGNLPFDRSGADLTAHALHAWALWRAALPATLAGRVERATREGLRFLRRRQRADGAWVPLWFGNQFAANEENPTYGTSRVLVGLCALGATADPQLREMIERGAGWLLGAQNADGGWGGDRGVSSSIEETGLAVTALATVKCERGADAITRGVRSLVEQTGGLRDFPPAPIGFYFAKLWYFERLYPLIFTRSALAAEADLAKP